MEGYGGGKSKGKGRSVYRRESGEPQVHFITQSRRTASVSIAETLSRLRAEVNGSSVIMRGTRTSFQTFTTKGSATVFLSDGTPLWDLKFRSLHARRPGRAASTKIMQARSWLGSLLVCTVSAERRAAEGAVEADTAKPSSSSSKYGPCRYGASCREKSDPSHCAKYSHPESPTKCATDGCDRMPSGRYRTCCAQCKDSGGSSHSSACHEIAPVATLVVEEATREGEDWILLLRGLSDTAARASSKLCRYQCGMKASVDGSRIFDTCCRHCCSDRGHDDGCGGLANPVDLADFQESADLSALLPHGVGMEGVPSGLKPVAYGELEGVTAKGIPKECGICFDDDMEGAPFLCQFSHSFCKACVSRHITEELETKGVLPACPLSAQCGHLLTREQIENIMGSTENAGVVIGRFDILAQRLGLQAIGAFPCARSTCPDWIVPSLPGRMQLVECPGCKVRFCSLCKRKPFHWRIPLCAHVPPVDHAWHEWLRNGRDAYLAKLAVHVPEYLDILEQLGSKKAEQARMLFEAEARKREFAEMEDWKVQLHSLQSVSSIGHLLHRTPRSKLSTSPKWRLRTSGQDLRGTERFGNASLVSISAAQCAGLQ